MRFGRIFRHRIHSLLRRPQVEAELQREIDLHLDQLTNEFRASGMSETEARMAARREFGGKEVIKERCRDMRRVNTVDDVLRDLVYAFRLSVKSPGFTLTAVVSLALSIGANTAVFSLLDAVMLKRLAVPNPETLRILTWVPVAELRTQEEQIENSLDTERLFAGLVTSFGALAALLAAIGLYGVLAYTVARRTSELGIRIALGASRGNVQLLVQREGLVTVALGMLVGVPAALALNGLIKNMLYGVTTTDAMSFAVALVRMIVVTVIPAWAPARRAARVDPMVALRYQ
jgi:ABC-type antimicrobial peptide transport system permease subunit